MATKKKMLQAAAGSATGGAGLDITEVFSTYLYKGDDSAQTITNGIDLAGEGGLVWVKNRGFTDTNTNITESHMLVDTERGDSVRLLTNTTGSNVSATNYFNSFNSDGFTVGTNMSNGFDGGHSYASWTFRKAPKFFDVVTYTGDSVAGKTVSHNLGSVPGMIIVKRLDLASSWCVYHQGLNGGVNPEQYRITLNTTDAVFDDPGSWNDTAPTDSVFSVGTTGNVNSSGATYVAYLFAHNDGDGGFGPSGDQDIIKCGSFIADSSGSATVNLGWEPQWILYKRTDSVGNWFLHDTMRGWPAGSGVQNIYPNTSTAESNISNATVYMHPTATGFSSSGNWFGADSTYIYMAIRRGPLAPPESATEVFNVETKGTLGAPAYDSGFPVDMLLVRNNKNTSFSTQAWDRLRSTFSLTNSTAAEEAFSSSYLNYFDHNDGFDVAGGPDTNDVAWMWKRAPGFFDVVAYSGDAVAGRTVSHNLGVAPEMIWVKKRNAARSWIAYHSGIGSGKFLELDNTSAAGTASTVWYDTDPTSTDFTVGTNSSVNQVPDTYIAYLFASLPGISKVGSYTGDGTTDGSKVIDCGFTSGARFVLIKRSNSGGSWYVWDTARGIVAGNDARLALNSTDEEASFDNVDPHSSGFSVVGSSINNINGGEYIFYAIA